MESLFQQYDLRIIMKSFFLSGIVICCFTLNGMDSSSFCLKSARRLDRIIPQGNYSPDDIITLRGIFAGLPSQYHLLLDPSISYRQLKQIPQAMFQRTFVWLLELAILQRDISKEPRSYTHGRQLANKIGLPTMITRLWCELADPDELWAQVSSQEELDAKRILQLNMRVF